MPFPWTLQRYIIREMGKTFLLTAIALTVVLSLGGGVRNIIRFGEVTPGQLLRLISLIVPVSVALTLPIAALFGAAATYGRLSADNEFMACRSSGINLHVLFLPPAALSLVSAAVTFGLVNFLIPGMVRNIEELLASDFGALIQQRLDRPRGITLGGKYRIRADDVDVDPANSNRVSLHGVAFVEADGEEWVRYGSARQVDLELDQTGRKARVSGRMADLSVFDRNEGRFLDLAEDVIPPQELETLFPLKIKFLNLPQLLHYRVNVDEWHEVSGAIHELRIRVGRLMLYDALQADWIDDGRLTLWDEELHYVVKADRAYRMPGGGRLELEDATIEEDRRGRHRSCHARRVIFNLRPAETLEDTKVEIEVRDARLSMDGVTLDRNKESLGLVAIPPDILSNVKRLPVPRLLRSSGGENGDPLADERRAAAEVRGESARRIIATINERMAFSVSVFVLVILGAALGIIFRGSQAVVAFGISFVPSLLVLVTILMGKQMSYNAPTHASGLVLMWAGIALVAALDAWTLTRVVRR